MAGNVSCPLTHLQPHTLTENVSNLHLRDSHHRHCRIMLLAWFLLILTKYCFTTAIYSNQQLLHTGNLAIINSAKAHWLGGFRVKNQEMWSITTILSDTAQHIKKEDWPKQFILALYTAALWVTSCQNDFLRHSHHQACMHKPFLNLLSLCYSLSVFQSCLPPPRAADVGLSPSSLVPHAESHNMGSPTAGLGAFPTWHDTDAAQIC